MRRMPSSAFRVLQALQGGKTFAHAGQQQARRFGELQVTAAALEQPAGEMLFEGTDMPADRIWVIDNSSAARVKEW